MNARRPSGENSVRPADDRAALLVGAEQRINNPAVTRLHEFYQDPRAPRAHDLLPAAFAAVRNAAGQVLLVRRIDDGNWELPGGRVEVGETARQAVVREVAEESGISIELTALSGVYSDPSHVLVDPDGSIHQQLALCFHAVPTDPDGEHPRPDGIETDGARWCAPAAAVELTMHPAMRLRLHDAVTAPDRTHFD
jgi:8-oxo-dGTP pyrophosphatase MutT (NUDIX family)